MSIEANVLITAADPIRAHLEANQGKVPVKDSGDLKLSKAAIKKHILTDMPNLVAYADAIRSTSTDATSGVRLAADITLGEIAHDIYGFGLLEDGTTPQSFYDVLGIQPARHNIMNLMTMPDFNMGYRWLVAEYIREAIRLGRDNVAVWPRLVAGVESVPQMAVVLPYVNMSDAMPYEMKERETFKKGSMSFTQKTVNCTKVGIGIDLSDEVIQQVSLNTLAVWLGDVGQKMSQLITHRAIQVLINGDQADGSESAPVIGVETVSAWEYLDMLRPMMRMSRNVRTPNRK